MLENHRHARGARIARGGGGIGAAVPDHRATVGFDESVDHLDQGRFSRPVFSQKRMNLALGDGETDVLIGDHAGISLGYALN